MTNIDREHPEYKQHRLMWHMYRDLYAGGQQFRHRAAEYLVRRQREPLDVYAERLYRAFYQNYIGSIIDWYAATLFRRPVSLQLTGGLPGGHEFLNAFADDCDMRGTDLNTFFRRCFIDALVMGRSLILLDFPRLSAAAHNRAEEDAVGLSRAYLVRYQPEDLINWDTDERGNLEWIVLRQKARRQASVDSGDVVEETYWLYYDKHQFRTYRRSDVHGDNGAITLVAEGPHCLSKLNRLPVVSLEVSDGLWLMNKAAHLQLEHFNKSNALGWAITMGLFAMPVIYSDREWSQMIGESYYVQLSPGDKFGWAEPDGKVYQIAAQNLETLKEEIYRVCYLSQASGETSGGHAVSAASKQMDFTITNEVLRAYGSAVKNTIRRVLAAVNDAREDGVVVQVTGLDEVDISDFGAEMNDASKLLSLGIDSPTLKRQIYTRLALKYLSEERQELKAEVAREIEAQLKSE